MLAQQTQMIHTSLEEYDQLSVVSGTPPLVSPASQEVSLHDRSTYTGVQSTDHTSHTDVKRFPQRGQETNMQIEINAKSEMCVGISPMSLHTSQVMVKSEICTSASVQATNAFHKLAEAMTILGSETQVVHNIVINRLGMRTKMEPIRTLYEGH